MKLIVLLMPEQDVADHAKSDETVCEALLILSVYDVVTKGVLLIALRPSPKQKRVYNFKAISNVFK